MLYVVRMDKTSAMKVLGGTAASAASAIGITPQAFGQWPDVLPRRLEDRVIAAIARKRLPPETFRPAPDLSGTAPPPGESPEKSRPDVGTDQMESSHV